MFVIKKCLLCFIHFSSSNPEETPVLHKMIVNQTSKPKPNIFLKTKQKTVFIKTDDLEYFVKYVIKM